MRLLEKYNIEPIGNYLILKREVISDTTESGLYTGRTPGVSNVAKVLAAGPGLNDNNGNRIEMQIKIGDTVIIDQYSGQEIEVEGDKIVVARETEVVAIISSSL